MSAQHNHLMNRATETGEGGGGSRAATSRENAPNGMLLMLAVVFSYSALFSFRLAFQILNDKISGLR